MCVCCLRPAHAVDGTNFKETDSSGSKSTSDGVWIGVIVGVMVLVIGGVIVVVKVSRSQSEGFVHYESSLSPSERYVCA